jgi:hypothetical protein
MSFDYTATAELFLAKRTKSSRENYRRFATAAEAIRYAVEDLRTARAHGAWMQVGDERFNSDDIQRLYDDGVFLCANFWATKRVRAAAMGPPPAQKPRASKRPPTFPKSRVKPRALAMTLTGVVKR